MSITDGHIHGIQEEEDIRLKPAIKNQYKLGQDGLQISDKYFFNKLMLIIWAQNRGYRRAWLARH